MNHCTNHPNEKGNYLCSACYSPICFDCHQRYLIIEQRKKIGFCSANCLEWFQQKNKWFRNQNRKQAIISFIVGIILLWLTLLLARPILDWESSINYVQIFVIILTLFVLAGESGIILGSIYNFVKGAGLDVYIHAGEPHSIPEVDEIIQKIKERTQNSELSIEEYESLGLYKLEFERCIKFMIFPKMSVKKLNQKLKKLNYLIGSNKLPGSLKVYQKENCIIIPVENDFAFIDFIRFYGILSNSIVKELFSMSSLVVGLNPSDPEKSFYMRHINRNILIGHLNLGKKFFIFLPAYLLDIIIPDDTVILNDKIGLPDLSIEELLRSLRINIFWLTDLKDQISHEIQLKI